MHMKTLGTQSAAALPTPTLRNVTPIIADLVSRAHSTRGVVLKDAAQEALLLFTTLVLGPQRSVDSTISVKTEVAASLNLWRKDQIEELALRAKGLARARSAATRSKTAHVARRAARLIHKCQFVSVANLVRSL